MPAPKGNQFWKARATHGRKKLFSSPELLWNGAQEYFKWCNDHPWKVKGQDVARPYTETGLALFLGMDTATLWSYGTSEAHKDFHNVIKKIKEVIYTQKYEGAAVGVFNHNIIARDLGLSDSVKNQHTGEDGGPIKVVYVDSPTSEET